MKKMNSKKTTTVDKEYLSGVKKSKDSDKKGPLSILIGIGKPMKSRKGKK